jgi:hypothetical protein
MTTDKFVTRLGCRLMIIARLLAALFSRVVVDIRSHHQLKADVVRAL